MINTKLNLKEIHDNPNDYKEFLDYPGYKIYRLHCTITDESYVGDNKTTMYDRLFNSPVKSGHLQCYHDNLRKDRDEYRNPHLYNSMRKYGLENFTIEILSTNIEDNEEMFISQFDSYHNGFNPTPTGTGYESTKGNIAINNGVSYKYIKPNELDQYLSDGWIRGGIKRGTKKVRRTILDNKLSKLLEGDKVLKELHDNGLKLNAKNWNLIRGKYMPTKSIPTYETYKEYSSNL